MQEDILPYRQFIDTLIELKQLPILNKETIAKIILAQVVDCISDYLADSPTLAEATAVNKFLLKRFDANWQEIINGVYKTMKSPLDEGEIEVHEGSMPTWWPEPHPNDESDKT